MTSLLDPRYATLALNLTTFPGLVLIHPQSLGSLLTLSGLDPVAWSQLIGEAPALGQCCSVPSLLTRLLAEFCCGKAHSLVGDHCQN